MKLLAKRRVVSFADDDGVLVLRFVRELNISAVPACASVNRVVGVLREFGCDRFRTDDSDLTDGEGVGLCRLALRFFGALGVGRRSSASQHVVTGRWLFSFAVSAPRPLPPADVGRAISARGREGSVCTFV